jgi:hypothetical protein
VIAMARGGILQYGVNVFKDGRTVIQSMRCPSDHRARVGAIGASDVDKLAAEARASRFADETDAYDYCFDAPIIVLALYDGCALKFAYGSCSLAAQKLDRMADLIDRTVGTGFLVPFLTDSERIRQVGPP